MIFLVDEKSFHKNLDLIIGNPPFQSLKEDKVNKEYSTITKKLKTQLGFDFSVKIPDNQLALMFLEASSLLLKPKGDLCFVQKSTSLLYNSGSKEFRNSLFNQFYVHQIIDFTLLKNDLFKSKGKEVLDNNGKPKLGTNGKPQKGKPTSVESCAVFYKNETRNDDYISNHIVSRLLKNTKDGLSFEFDYYDFYEISRNEVLEDVAIWRCNLLGGNRLNHLIKKLNKKTNFQTTLKDYVLNHLKIDEESYSEGYMRGYDDDSKESEIITSNLNLLSTNFDVKTCKLSVINSNQKFIRTRVEEKLYKTPLITIKELISKNQFPIGFHSIGNYIPFDSRIVGISFSEIENGLEISEKLYNNLKRNERINALKTLATCSQFFLGSSSVIQKADINNWTIPLIDDEIKLSDSEKIVMNDVLDYIYPSWYEKEPIINKKEASRKNLAEFSEVFNQSFNSIYKKENKEQKLAIIYEGSTFFALEFEFTDKKITQPKEVDKTEADKQIENLIVNQYGKNTLVNKVLQIYSPNKITLIKPKKLRFWLKSIALQDSDEIFDDIIENGLK